MSNQLLEIKANKLLNRTIFPHKLKIYDDVMVFWKRGIIRIHEVTISYNQISQVYLSRGLIFGSLEIINSGGVENIIIKHVPKKQAIKAKNIIDQKIYHVHAKEENKEEKDVAGVHEFEKSVNRLKELLNRGKISKREYERKRKQMLKGIG